MTTKYIQGKDGKFQGSIGEGRDNTPSAAPATATRPSEDTPSVDLTKLAELERGGAEDRAQLLGIVARLEADEMMEGPDWTLVSTPDIEYDGNNEAVQVTVDLGYEDPKVTVTAYRDHENKVCMYIEGVYNHKGTYRLYPEDGRSIGQAHEMLELATNEDAFMDHEYLEKAQPVNEFAKELGLKGRVVSRYSGYEWHLNAQELDRDFLWYHDIGEIEDREALGDDGVIEISDCKVQLSEGGSTEFFVYSWQVHPADQDRVDNLREATKSWLGAKALEAQRLDG